jgi:hypothetical protein
MRVRLVKQLTPELPVGSIGTIYHKDVKKWPHRGMYRVFWDNVGDICMFRGELEEIL